MLIPVHSASIFSPPLPHPVRHIVASFPLYHAATAATSPATTIATTPASTLPAALFFVALALAALPVAVPLALPLELEVPPFGPCALAPAL